MQCCMAFEAQPVSSAHGCIQALPATTNLLKSACRRHAFIYKVQGGRIGQYMDLLIKPALECCGPLVTEIFDKKRAATFRQHLQAIQYQHMDTMLSARCLYNTFHGQVIRYARLISEPGAFVDQVSLLIFDLDPKGYEV